jgi:hypothetical protein
MQLGFPSVSERQIRPSAQTEVGIVVGKQLPILPEWTPVAMMGQVVMDCIEVVKHSEGWGRRVAEEVVAGEVVEDGLVVVVGCVVTWVELVTAESVVVAVGWVVLAALVVVVSGSGSVVAAVRVVFGPPFVWAALVVSSASVVSADFSARPLTLRKSMPPSIRC